MLNEVEKSVVSDLVIRNDDAIHTSLSSLPSVSADDKESDGKQTQTAAEKERQKRALKEFKAKIQGIVAEQLKLEEVQSCLCGVIMCCVACVSRAAHFCFGSWSPLPPRTFVSCCPSRLCCGVS